MSATPPPGYTPPPADLPQRGDRATFSNRVDAWVTWFSTVILSQVAAMISNAYANALDAYASATAAMGFRDAALAAQTAAEAARDTAQSYRDTAQSYRDQAAASAAAAAASAAAAATSFSSTSATSLALGTGAKVFSTQAGKGYTANAPARASSASDPTKYMDGVIASYSGTTLALTSNSYSGSGTVSDWVITLTGAPGVQGPVGGVNGGNLTSGLNELKSANLASTATIDPWSVQGNYVPLTGTTTVTGAAAAPQAGARRTLLATAATPLQAGANFMIDGLASGASYTLAAGDQVDMVAETTTKFHLTIHRRDGKATAGALLVEVIITSSQAWTVPATDFEIEICGGGQNGKNSSDYGGACGAYAKKRFTGATIGAIATITIGTGGASTSSGTRNNGGTSSFVLSGFTTVNCGGGADTGATASGGDVNINGVRGDSSVSIGAGNNTSGDIVNLYRSGKGADGMMGCGAPPGSTSSLYSSTGWGSGGAGGCDTTDTNGNPSLFQSGSAGQGGVCKIRYFI